jgi:hypothetical protein
MAKKNLEEGTEEKTRPISSTSSTNNPPDDISRENVDESDYEIFLDDTEVYNDPPFETGERTPLADRMEVFERFTVNQLEVFKQDTITAMNRLFALLRRIGLHKKIQDDPELNEVMKRLARVRDTADEIADSNVEFARGLYKAAVDEVLYYKGNILRIARVFFILSSIFFLAVIALKFCKSDSASAMPRNEISLKAQRLEGDLNDLKNSSMDIFRRLLKKD